MSHHYKRYSLNQLQEEENDLKERLAEAENLDQKNYIAVYKRKIEIDQSYMLDQDQFYVNRQRCNFLDRKSTPLNSSHVSISYAVFYLQKKKIHPIIE